MVGMEVIWWGCRWCGGDGGGGMGMEVVWWVLRYDIVMVVLYNVYCPFIYNVCWIKMQ